MEFEPIVMPELNPPSEPNAYGGKSFAEMLDVPASAIYMMESEGWILA